MPTPDLQRLDGLVADLPERAARFVERGAAVPFTTPMLAPARLRRLPGRAPELLLPALGGRGTYVLDWPSCRGLSPTLHDRTLWPLLAALPDPSPAGLRHAARTVAAQGLAGRAAKAAALAARDRRSAMRQALEARFAACGPAAPVLAEALAETGTEGEPASPIGLRLAALGELAEAATAQALAAPLPLEREAARLLASAARLALAGARAALGALRQAAQALSAAPHPAAVAQLAELAARPDWLLDGWCRPAALCRLAGSNGAPPLTELLAALPAPALEAEGWWSSAGGWEAVLRGRARLPASPPGPGAAAVDQVARLEAVRAVAA